MQDTCEETKDGGAKMAQRPDDGNQVKVVAGVGGEVKGCERLLPLRDGDVGWPRLVGCGVLVAVERVVVVVVAAQRVVVKGGGELLPRLFALLDIIRQGDGLCRTTRKVEG